MVTFPVPRICVGCRRAQRRRLTSSRAELAVTSVASNGRWSSDLVNRRRRSGERDVSCDVSCNVSCSFSCGVLSLPTAETEAAAPMLMFAKKSTRESVVHKRVKRVL